MKKVLAYTDIHMRSRGEKIIGLDPFQQFQDALAHGLEKHPDLDQIVLMGDLANSGKTSEYQRVAEILKDCSKPVTLMMGNHDNRVNMLEVFPDTPCTPSGHVQNIVRLGDDTLIMLDTLDGPPFRNDYHAGILCPDRLDWLKSALERVRDTRVSIFTHHPVSNIGIDGIDAIGLKNDDVLLDLLKGYPNVAHVFSGHVHRSISGSKRGLGYTLFKSTCHQTPLILGAKSDSMAVPEPSGYGVILLLPDTIVAHTEDFQVAIHDSTPQPDSLPD